MKPEFVIAFGFVIAGSDPQSMARLALSEGMDPGSSPG